MPETPREPSTTEIAAYIKTIWTALIAPKWTYDELVTLGKAVYAKIPLAKIDPAVMSVLLPKLRAIAHQVATNLPAASSLLAEPAPDPSPGEAA